MRSLKNFFQKFIVPHIDYQPLIEVRIFKDAILHNLKEHQTHYPKLQFVPVLKSNAYGHGLVQIGGILDKQGLPFFMVDSFYEALLLRRNGIKTKILILGYTRAQQILKPVIENISFGITSLEQLEIISANLKQQENFHLKIDTGMHRQGILFSQIPPALGLMKKNKCINLEGVCSHFADADNSDSTFTDEQIEKWNEAVKIFKKEFPYIKYFHAANTAGTAYASKIDANVGRLGLGLYGINTAATQKLDLQPALEMVSVISSIKNLQPGDKVGYGITYESKTETKIATVPVGYNEGVDRRLSNRGIYRINNVECPIAGRVSMNISSIDVTRVNNVRLEQEVIIFSHDPQDKNSIENCAKQCGCLPYEILVHIPQYLKRTVI